MLSPESYDQKFSKLSLEDKLATVFKSVMKMNKFKFSLSESFMYALVLKMYGIELSV